MSERALARTQKQDAAFAESPRTGILQRKCACGNHRAVGSQCTDCSKTKLGLQRKLTIGASNAPLEQEADRAADQVMAGPVRLPVSTMISRIQRYAGPSANGGEIVSSNVDRVLASPGVSLQPGLRQDMERGFGYDFSKVRVHTGSVAEQSAQELHAAAYTVGNHIAFATGRYSPASRESQRLIAHELSHVVQQTSPGTTAFQRAEASPPISSRNIGARTSLQDRPTVQPDQAHSNLLLQRQESHEIEAPDVEAVADPGGVKLPTASADPRSNSDFIDRRLNAVGVGLSGVDFILFCDGIPNPIALPLDYIDLASVRSEPVDHLIYSSREEALEKIPFGPPAADGASQFAFYRVTGGLIVPSRFSAASSPETIKLIVAAREKLRQFVNKVTDTLVMAVLLYAAVALAKIGISRWVLPRIGAPRKLPIDEALPQPKGAAPRTKTSPAATAPASTTAPKISAEPDAPPKTSSPAAGEQLRLFPELSDSAPSRPLVPQISGPSSPAGRVPRIDVGEIKSVQSEAAGWRQVNGRKFTHKISDSSHEAVATYSADGTVRLKIRVSGGQEKSVFDEVIGQVPKQQLPSAPYGTKQFGDEIEDPVRIILERATGQKFFIKNPSATGPDILPPQTSLPVEH
jgi:Domain of unknown function (DUF4157)